MTARWVRMGVGLGTVTFTTLGGALAQTPPAAQPAPAAATAAPAGPNTDAHYALGPDSLPREGVPKGEVRGPFVIPSQAYPGTQHTYWVYVPAQYDPAVPASLMVFNDGQAFKDMEGSARAPNVLERARDRRRAAAGAGQGPHRLEEPRPPRHRRHELERDRCLHGRVAAAERIPQGVQHRRQLRQPAGGATAPTTSAATGSTRTCA